MPNSYPSRSTRTLAILSGITLLVALCAAARAGDRSPSPAPSHSTRDLGHPAATGLETCPSNSSSKPTTAGGAAHDAASTTPTPASAHSQSPTRDKTAERGGGSRLKRSGEGRVAPRAPLEEPRRGGVGTLIGISFA